MLIGRELASTSGESKPHLDIDSAAQELLNASWLNGMLAVLHQTVDAAAQRVACA